MKPFKNRLLVYSLAIFTLSTQAFSMGAKAPAATTTTSSRSSALPLIENLLPLFSSDSPLAQTAIPLLGGLTGTTTGNSVEGTLGTVLSTVSSITNILNGHNSANNSTPITDQIKDMVIGSACSDHVWSNGSTAPIGYVKGAAVGFARNLCQLKNGTSADSLRSLFVQTIGKGMNVGDGSVCSTNGIFKTKFNTANLLPELLTLYSQYKSGTKGSCLLETFAEGQGCIPGNPSAASINSLGQSCPAFAVDSTVAMLKANLIKPTETVPECDQLLRSVQDLVQGDLQSFCNEVQ